MLTGLSCTDALASIAVFLFVMQEKRLNSLPEQALAGLSDGDLLAV